MKRTLAVLDPILVLATPGSAFAKGNASPTCQQLLNQYFLEHDGTGTPPGCVNNGSGWQLVVNDPGTGIPGWFGFLAFVIVALGIGATVWRVSVARSAARRGGMDPDEATAMTLLSDNGLEATYLASQARQVLAGDTRLGSGQEKEPDDRTVTERLAELDALKRQGLVSDEEYAAKRSDILEDL